MIFAFHPAPAPPQPVFSIDLRGRVSGAESVALRPGTSTQDIVTGRVFAMTGKLGGLLVEDNSALKITNSIGISCWVKLAAFPSYASQLVFRGDDREGLDPYSLVIHQDGTINFGIQDAQNQGCSVSSPMPLSEWTHVVASLDDSRGTMRLWLNGQLVAAKTTAIRPFADLDQGSSPGVGIGNVQNDRGPHNQPFQGLIGDVRVYAAPITPKLVGYSPQGWRTPYFD